MSEWMIYNQENNDWVTLLLFFNFLLFVSLKTLYTTQFYSFIRLFGSQLFINNFGDKPILTQGFNFLMGFFTLLNISLFLTLVLSNFGYVHFQLYSFLIIFFGISGVCFLRVVIVQFFGLLIKEHFMINNYQFRQFTYLNWWGLFLYIGLIIYCYSWSSLIFYQSFLILALGLYLFFQFLVIWQLFKPINKSGLYFILYLCTLKLSPWILLLNGLNHFDI